MKHGLLVNAANRVPFSFDGQQLSCFEGDTIATAMWRNNVKTLSRSFKYHRRRGILSLAGYDANTLVDIKDSPNTNAEIHKVTPGMEARSIHCSGSLESDRLAVLTAASPLLGAGFYYKAFYKPAGAWRYWEPVIRRLAGLGTVDAKASMTADKFNEFCDVAVVGGGPAGISAAINASKGGASVCLLDKNPLIGGSLNWLPGGEDEKDKLNAELLAQSGVRVMTEWEVTSIFDDNYILAAKGAQTLMRLRAKKIIIATGVRTLPVVFSNNDLPGIMLTPSALRLAYGYDLSCGTTVVMLASDETDVIAARALAAYGIKIAAVFNLNDAECEWAKTLIREGFSVYHELSSFAADGRHKVQEISAKAGGKKLHIKCDCILMNAGRVPVTELAASAGVNFSYDDNLHTLYAVNQSNIVLAGAVNGRLSLDNAIADGEAADSDNERPQKDTVALPANPVYVSKSLHNGKAFIDFEEDLQPKDLDEAIDEGFNDIQLLKRYTTAGMGPAQGKLGNLQVLRHLARRLGKPTSTVGQVTARPPAAAETFAQLAGANVHLQPLRRSALHHQHKHLSASFMNAGSWQRPAIYQNAEEEAGKLRNDAGLIDVSTLGKIQISGDDATAFLGLLYTGGFLKQKVGASRYGLMLDEFGIIIDDGVIAKIDDNKFIVTTTTANSDSVYRLMLLWKARWQMNVAVLNITSAYASINLSGPNALKILSAMTEEDITDLAHMGVRHVTLKSGVPVLLLRTGFVGEKGYEIYISYGHAATLWSELANNATPCGVEAQRLLRLEKGHIIVGQDTDAMTTPYEADMAWSLGKNKDFYIGMRALAMHPGVKQKLCGFVTDAAWKYRINECDLVLNRKGEITGRVTSVAYSPATDSVIGLAYTAPDNTTEGQEINIRINNGAILNAKVKKPPFYDPEGERLK